MSRLDFKQVDLFSLRWRHSFDLGEFRLLDIYIDMGVEIGLFDKIDIDIDPPSIIKKLPKWYPLNEMLAYL